MTAEKTGRRQFLRRAAASTAAPHVISSAALGSQEKEPASQFVVQRYRRVFQDIDLIKKAIARRWVPSGTSRSAIPVPFTPGRGRSREIPGRDLHGHEIQLVEVQVHVGIAGLQDRTASTESVLEQGDNFVGA